MAAEVGDVTAVRPAIIPAITPLALARDPLLIQVPLY